MAKPQKDRVLLSCERCGELGEYRSEDALVLSRRAHNAETGHVAYRRVDLTAAGDKIRADDARSLPSGSLRIEDAVGGE